MVESANIAKSIQNDVFDSLDDLGYEGPMYKQEVFEKAVNEGLQSVDFTMLVEWITMQLNGFAGLEEHVHATTEGSDDADTFLMELSGFLREYGCPYKNLVEGQLQQRFISTEDRLLLLDYLLTELQAARIVFVKQPYLKKANINKSESIQSQVTDELQDMIHSLGVPDLNDDITASELFTKLGEQINQGLGEISLGHLGAPLLTVALSDDGWQEVEYISQALKQDYACRRQMLIQRLDVTIQSFRWSEKVQGDDKLNTLYRAIRCKMSPDADVSIAHLLAARDDLLQAEKTSGDLAREKTKCAVNRVMIGAVPDRGGRPREMDRPAPDMPSFQQRRPQKDGGHFSRGGRGNRGSHQTHSHGGQDSRRHRH